MDEAAARRVLLARAVESVAAPTPLVATQELQAAERLARAEAVRAREGRSVDPETFLDLRAQRVLATAGVRNPWLVAMLEPGGWQRWAGRIVPFLAFVAGVLTDVVGDPHRVDLLSLPLLGMVAWNLVVYVLLVVEAVLPHRGGRGERFADLGRWTSGVRAFARRRTHLRLQVTAAFERAWFATSAAAHVERVKRVLHVSAAAWAIGVMTSLLVRGLVVEYRVGWESTFLSPQQVHAVLAALRVPALLLFPFPPVTATDVAAMRFDRGSGGAAEGAHWVLMYCALLVTVVVVPRLLLAAVAWWGERAAARRMRVDLQDPYFARIVSLLDATVVQVALYASDPQDADAMRRVFAHDLALLPAALTSGQGDVLRVVDVPPLAALHEPAQPTPRWRSPWSGVTAQRKDPVIALRDATDVLLAVVRDMEALDALRPVAQWFGKPVLVVQRDDLGMHAVVPGWRALPWSTFGACWVQEPVLRRALRDLLPAPQLSGHDRLAQAWEDRNLERMRRAMAAIAEHVAQAARESVEVQAGALGVRSVLAAEREAQEQARQRAMETIRTRLDASAARMVERLCQLHGVERSTEAALTQRMEQRFMVQQPVHAQQAGLAGAATGAAMGASVDLLLGGLTLGAAAAVGALVGGGAAWIGAAWKNRATPSGATVVQLSDAMLEALLEAALLRYIAVVHAQTPASVQDPAQWPAVVAQATHAHAPMLGPLWGPLRSKQDRSREQELLTDEVESIAFDVLARMHPGMQRS